MKLFTHWGLCMLDPHITIVGNWRHLLDFETIQGRSFQIKNKKNTKI